VRTILTRWNAEGPAGLADRRPARDGGTPKLSDEQQAALFEALQGRPDDGGLWTGPEVAAYARDRWGVAVRPETGGRRLRRLGLSLQGQRVGSALAAIGRQDGNRGGSPYLRRGRLHRAGGRA
jgi:transposase